MKLEFEDENISQEIKDTVKDIIENRRDGEIQMRNRISVEEIFDDDRECYDDPNGFIESHRDCEIYLVSQLVSDSWFQPLTMVAVVEY